MRRLRYALACARLAAVSVGLAACGGSEQPPAAPGILKGERRDTRIVHEPCDAETGDAEPQDVNGDGRADITIVRSGGTELCRFLDLNFDGVVDVWVYKDPSGAVRRRESDFDRDGVVDEIALLRSGQLMEKHRATSLSGALDTWNYFEGGRLVRTVRDSDGDSVIDQWWEYDANKPDCPLVHSDVDHDGLPDPGASVDLCSAEGLAPQSDEEPADDSESRIPEPDRAPVEIDPETGKPKEAEDADP